MSRATFTVKGHLSKDPELRHTQQGEKVLSLNVGHTPRRKNATTDEWEDAGPTLWVQASIWGDDAELYAPLVRKGTLVQIEGEPTLRTWEKDGRSGVNVEVKRAHVSLFPRRPSTPSRSAPAPAAPADEWYTAPIGDEEPF